MLFKQRSISTYRRKKKLGIYEVGQFNLLDHMHIHITNSNPALTQKGPNVMNIKRPTYWAVYIEGFCVMMGRAAYN
jgi:hypothetical protein